MPRAPAPIPPALRSRLEYDRLDTLALLRALDQALVLPAHLPQPQTSHLFELDADCAEALWALDQPPGSLNLAAMLRDTLASLDVLPSVRDQLRQRLSPGALQRVLNLEGPIRAGLDPREAYNDVPGRAPHLR